MRNTFMDTIIDASASRDDIFIISGDAGLGVFDTFKEEHPDRFLNLGAAEQNMISFAAGMAITGFKVVVYNIIPFVLYRCYEQVRNDICYQNLPVILVGIGSGLTYSPQGMTHYSVEDIGLARTLPNLGILSPIDPIEARLAAQYALSATEPVYVRLAKRGEPNIHNTGQFDITLPQVLQQGNRVAILCHGSICEEVLQAGKLLADEGIQPCIISVPMLQPLNSTALGQVLQGMDIIVTVEEHYSSCGLGRIMREYCQEAAPGSRLVTLGIPSRFIHEIHDTAGMRRLFKINGPAIAATVKEVLATEGKSRT